MTGSFQDFLRTDSDREMPPKTSRAASIAGVQVKTSDKQSNIISIVILQKYHQVRNTGFCPTLLPSYVVTTACS